LQQTRGIVTLLAKCKQIRNSPRERGPGPKK
jgi:hypothetical protein